MQLKCLTLCTPLTFWVEILQISIICLICFGYDLSDFQDELKRWRMGFIFCGKHPLLLTRIQVSDKGSWVLLFFLFIGLLITATANVFLCHFLNTDH